MLHRNRSRVTIRPVLGRDPASATQPLFAQPQRLNQLAAPPIVLVRMAETAIPRPMVTSTPRFAVPCR